MQTHPNTNPELTKSPHGNTRYARVTADKSARINARLAELCAKGTPAPDIAAIINQEFGLNWSRATYWLRVRKLGQVWTPGERQAEITHRRLTAAQSVRLDQRIAELCAQQTPGLDIATIINKEMGFSYSSRTYWRWVRQRGLVWMPGGKRRRLTAALAVRVDQRIAELCAQQTPAPDIATIINQEFRLNWSLNTYWGHLRDHGYVWTPGKRRTLGARTCQFQGEGCRGTFEANTAWQKYCDVCRKPACAASEKTYRKEHREHIRERHKRYLPSFYRDSDPAKYRKMMDGINASGREWRKRNPEKVAATLKRFKAKHAERLKEINKLRWAERQRKLAEAERLAAIKSMSDQSGRAAVYFVQHRDASNPEMREATGVTLTDRQLTTIRQQCGVPGPKGRPSRKKM